MRRAKYKIGGFKYPTLDTIRSRSSTICRSMACTLQKRKPCELAEEEKWLQFFNDKKCAYCGADATQLDHLNPLVRGKEPTGYCSEPANLVPCCSRCNSAKRNSSWEEFMQSDKLKQRIGLLDDGKLDKRRQLLKKFQQEMRPQTVVISREKLKRWHGILEGLNDAFENAQKELDRLINEQEG